MTKETIMSSISREERDHRIITLALIALRDEGHLTLASELAEVAERREALSPEAYKVRDALFYLRNGDTHAARVLLERCLSTTKAERT